MENVHEPEVFLARVRLVALLIIHQVDEDDEHSHDEYVAQDPDVLPESVYALQGDGIKYETKDKRKGGQWSFVLAIPVSDCLYVSHLYSIAEL